MGVEDVAAGCVNDSPPVSVVVGGLRAIHRGSVDLQEMMSE